MRRAPALSFLLVTVFVDLLGLGLIVPIVPALMTDLTGDDATAAAWSGLLGSTFGLLQFLAAPLLGRLSDRYGRRPVLLAAQTCLGGHWLAHATATGPQTLLVFHALTGACAATSTVVNASIADVTGPADRARAYGLVGSAFGLGFVAGPTVGGLLGAVDVRLPFFAAAALSFANVLYGWFVLPESRPGDRTTPLSLRMANPVSAIAVVLRRPGLGRLAYARLCADVARMTYQSTWAFFLTYRFAWSTTHVGAVMAAGALAGAVFQAKAVGPVVRRLGDKRAAVAGGLAGAATLAGTAFVTVPWALFAVQAVGVLGAIGGAAAQSWISRSVRSDEQGTVQGALTGIGAIAETVVPAAGVDLDGTLWTRDAMAGSDRPFLFAGRETLDAHERETWDAYRGPNLEIHLTGSTHRSFVDFAILVTQAATALNLTPEQLTTLLGTIRPERAALVLRVYLRAFFDTHLRGRPDPLLDRPSRRYPEVTFTRGRARREQEPARTHAANPRKCRQVMSASIKPRLAGRQPSVPRVGCPG